MWGNNDIPNPLPFERCPFCRKQLLGCFLGLREGICEMVKYDGEYVENKQGARKRRFRYWGN